MCANMIIHLNVCSIPRSDTLFPASRGLSRRGKNERKERETSASRETRYCKAGFSQS